MDTHDRVAIRALVDGYATCVDTRDGSGFAALFTDDGRLRTFRTGRAQEATSEHVGHDALAAVPPRLDRYDTTRHVVTTHHAREAVGDEATGVTYCEAHHLTGDVDEVMAIRYLDRYRRAGHVWRIADREVHVDWVEHRPVER